MSDNRVTPEERKKSFLEFSALARQVGAEAAAAQRPDLYLLMQGRPAPAPVGVSSRGGKGNRDRSLKPGPWYRWCTDLSMWAWVPGSEAEIAAMQAGETVVEEMTSDEVVRRRKALHDGGDEAA
jgi:hypothetical protein